MFRIPLFPSIELMAVVVASKIFQVVLTSRSPRHQDFWKPPRNHECTSLALPRRETALLKSCEGGWCFGRWYSACCHHYGYYYWYPCYGRCCLYHRRLLRPRHPWLTRRLGRLRQMALTAKKTKKAANDWLTLVGAICCCRCCC